MLRDLLRKHSHKEPVRGGGKGERKRQGKKVREGRTSGQHPVSASSHRGALENKEYL